MKTIKRKIIPYRSKDNCKVMVHPKDKYKFFMQSFIGCLYIETIARTISFNPFIYP